MGQGRINTLKKLHQEVIHELIDNEKMYIKEDREIKKIKSDAVLNLICAKCFPLKVS